MDAIDLGALADRFVACFPKLNAEGRRVFVALYRELSLGEPAPAQQVARRAGVSLHQVNALLDAVPAVYREEGTVIGFWGLTVRPLSKHRFHTGDRTLYTRCAWDALFIPMILGKTAYVESEDALHFFASEASGRAWITKHPGAMLLSLEDAFELGRRTNQMRYGEALMNAS